MDRINFVEIAGKKYPLSFSLQATKAVARKFGSVEKIGEQFSDGDLNEEKIDGIVYVVETLIRSGCAYLNLFCADLPKEPGAHIVDDKYYCLSTEALEVAITFDNMGEIMQSVMECMRMGQESEIEIKNMEAPEVSLIEPISTYGAEG